MAVSSEEWAYAAGILDGEGSLRINPASKKSKAPQFVPRMQIGNSDHNLLKWLQERFGGSIHAVKPRVNLQIHTWQLCSRQATSFVAGCLPYLIAKKAEAEVFLRYYSEGNFCIGNARPSPAEVERRLGLMSEIKAIRTSKFLPRGEKLVTPAMNI